MSTPMRRLMFRTWFAVTGRSPVYARVRRLRDAYGGNREALDQTVRERLANMLRHARRHVPYYRRLFDSLNLRPTVETVVFDLARVPILTKDVLQREFEALRSDRPGRGARANTSGGSTGEPTRFIQDLSYRNWADANKLLFASWLGFRPGDALLKIWGAPRDIFGGGGSLKSSLRSFMLNEHVLNCYRITPEIQREFASTINRLRPPLIEAYADAAYEFSRFVIDEGIKLHRPQGIITSAGVLLPHMKLRIGEAFGCTVLNRYGSREVGDVACSCPRGDALHVSELTHYVEILDENGRACEAGQEGDVVVTVLTNYTMPLIRYRIEDRAVPAEGTCACGRPTRLLAAVSGRRSDFLTATDGTRINGTALTTLMHGVPGIRRYQFRQTGSASLIFAVEPSTPDHGRLREILEPVLGKLARLIGDEFDVDVRIVEHIPPTATGKYMHIINDTLAQSDNPAGGEASSEAYIDTRR